MDGFAAAAARGFCTITLLLLFRGPLWNATREQTPNPEKVVRQQTRMEGMLGGSCAKIFPSLHVKFTVAIKE